MHSTQISDKAFRKFVQEATMLQLNLALMNLQATLEQKAYNPKQPRVPKGQREGGEWLPQFFSRFSKDALAFAYAHRKEITRLLGGLQAVGGMAEIFGGGTAMTGGVATAETGMGLAAVGAGAWMFAHGYDDVETGLRALITGDPQQTTTYKTLRSIGLSDAQASAVEISLAGGSALTAGMTLGQIEARASAKLAALSLQPFAPDALTVEVKGQSLWKTPGNGIRGLASEDFDVAQTGFKQTPSNFPVFDQVSEDGRIAISDKTLDLTASSYGSDARTAIYTRLNKYTDAAANYSRDSYGGFELPAKDIVERHLNVLMPAGDPLPAQSTQIASATHYAATRGVKLTIYYAH